MVRCAAVLMWRLKGETVNFSGCFINGGRHLQCSVGGGHVVSFLLQARHPVLLLCTTPSSCRAAQPGTSCTPSHVVIKYSQVPAALLVTQ